MNLKFVTLASAALAVTTVHASVIIGPFVSGTGNWTTISNGGFESGTTNDWTGPVSASTSHPDNATLPYSNTYTGRTQSPGTYPGAGYSINHIVSVTTNTDYIISGFFRRTATAGQAYIDLNDIPGESQAMTVQHNTTDWQFVHSSWNSGSNTSITMRVVMDNGVQLDQVTYFDEIALTRAEDFVAPEGVPEPATMALLAPGLLALRKRKKRNL